MGTWVDVPGSTLPSNAEPLDYVASAELAFISVGFRGRRGEELAYRDGTFLPPYESSVRSGDTYSLRRAGGWPSAPTVHVEEKSGGGAAAWDVLYHVDFRALAAQTFATPGAHTIDGLTWYLKPGINSFNTPPAIDARGLRIGTTSASELAPTSAIRRMILPMASIPGYDAAAPLCWYVRMDAEASNANAVVGVMDCALNASAPTVQEYERRQGISRNTSHTPSSPGAGNQGYIWGTGYVDSLSASASLPALTEVQAGRSMHILDRKSVHCGVFDWRGAAPNPLTGPVDGNQSQSRLSLGQSPSTGTDMVRDMSNISLYVAHNHAGFYYNPVSAWLCELMVWQPRVA